MYRLSLIAGLLALGLGISPAFLPLPLSAEEAQVGTLSDALTLELVGQVLAAEGWADPDSLSHPLPANARAAVDHRGERVVNTLIDDTELTTTLRSEDGTELTLRLRRVQNSRALAPADGERADDPFLGATLAAGHVQISASCRSVATDESNPECAAAVLDAIEAAARLTR